MIRGWKRRVGLALGALAVAAGIAPTAASAEQTALQNFALTSDYSGLCLDIAGGNLGNGAALNIWSCHTTSAERWYWNGSQLRSLANDKCVSVAGGQDQDGAIIYMWDCDPNWATQKWSWNGRQLRSVNAPGKCLSVSGANRGPGAAIHLWECGSHPNQGWGMA